MSGRIVDQPEIGNGERRYRKWAVDAVTPAPDGVVAIQTFRPEQYGQIRHFATTQGLGRRRERGRHFPVTGLYRHDEKWRRLSLRAARDTTEATMEDR
jgi:hypothetical protein